MRLRRVSDQRGTTLIESVVALGLFAIGAATISTLMTHQLRLEVTNGTATTAIALAERELEDLRAVDYADINSRSKSMVVGGARYDMQTTVRNNQPRPNMKEITAKVSWTEPIGRKEYSLYAIYTQVSR